jgi:hypothetical protein
VTREEITEEQRREVQIGFKRQDYQKQSPQPTDKPVDLNAIFGAPIALGTTEAKTADEALDVDAFLAGGAVDDEDEKLARLTGGTAQGGAPPPPPKQPPAEEGPVEIDVDNDFLSDPGTSHPAPGKDFLAGPTPPDLAKVPQQPKAETPTGVPGVAVAKTTDDL